MNPLYFPIMMYQFTGSCRYCLHEGVSAPRQGCILFKKVVEERHYSIGSLAHVECLVYEVIDLYQNYRGGASEASVATLTGDVDGSSRYIIRASSPWANYSTRMRKWC